MVLRCVCRITSARKQRRICADKKIDYFAAFQKIFCSFVTASSETTDSDKKAFARDENKKKTDFSSDFSEEISSDARKKSLSRILKKHTERF